MTETLRWNSSGRSASTLWPFLGDGGDFPAEVFQLAQHFVAHGLMRNGGRVCLSLPHHPLQQPAFDLGVGQLWLDQGIEHGARLAPDCRPVTRFRHNSMPRASISWPLPCGEGLPPSQA